MILAASSQSGKVLYYLTIPLEEIVAHHFICYRSVYRYVCVGINTLIFWMMQVNSFIEALKFTAETVFGYLISDSLSPIRLGR